MAPPIAIATPEITSTPTNSWEDLNSQAKEVEDKIDALFIQLSRTPSDQGTNVITALDSAIAHLTSILDAQTALLSTQLPGHIPTNTAQRHREILAEYQRELKRSRNCSTTPFFYRVFFTQAGDT